MRDTIIIRFSSADLAWCRETASQRNAPKMRAGMGAGTYKATGDPFQAHYEGVRAELAVSRAIDCGIDTSVSMQGNKHGNLVLSTDVRGFARYRRKRGWDLALKSDNPAHFYGDVAFLVWPESVPSDAGALEVMGWINREEFLAVATTREYLQRGKRLAVGVSRLHPLSQRITTKWEPGPAQAALLL